MNNFITTDLNKRIKSYLIKYPMLRDSDNMLMARIWHDEIEASQGLIENATEVLIAIAKRQLSPWESATRCRRKIQEKYPELRGQKYNLRQGKAKQVNKEMKRKTPFQQGNIF